MTAIDNELFNACCLGDVKSVNSLISGGQIQNYNYGLWAASRTGNLELVHLMIQHGADELARGIRDGWFYDHLNVVAFLIQVVNYNNKKTNIHYWCSWPRNILLYSFDIRIEAFRKIKRYQELLTFVANVKVAILKSIVILPDLLNILSYFNFTF